VVALSISPHTALYIAVFVYAHQTVILTLLSAKGAITSKIKHAVKLKTSPARLAQLLQPSLAFCF